MLDAQVIGEDRSVIETIATTLDHLREEISDEFFKQNYLAKEDLLKKTKENPDFGKTEHNLSHKIEIAPYWATLSSMVVHITVSGNAIADIFTFGRIAGNSAANQK